MIASISYHLDSGFIFHDNCIACSAAFARVDMAVLSHLLVWHLILRWWQENSHSWVRLPVQPIQKLMN
jgi:hypothetical protein